MKFNKIQLKELIDYANTGADAIQRAPIVDYDTGIKCIRIGDISNNRKYEKWGFTEITKENYHRYKLDVGDILIARTGSTIGISKIIKNKINSVYNNGLIKVKVNKVRCNSKYFYYILQSKEFINYIQGIAFGTTGQPNMKINDFLKFEINNISLEKQNKIVNILSKFDDKIEINNQTNDNLYKILEQYIKEHYYNNEFVRNGNVNDIGKIQGGYAFKSKDLLNETTNNKVLKIKNISASGVDIDNTQCVYDEVANKVDKKFLLLRGNVIIAMTGAELGKTGYLYGQDYRYFLNQRVGVIRGNDKYSELYLNCLFILNDMQNTLNSKGYGSAQPNISTSDIENIEIPIPKEDELETFYEKCNPIYSKMILNSEQNQSLTQLRDTLLPKLMNGEIDLDKIEI